MTPPPDLLVGELLPLLRRFCAGEHGIALGGSHAKACADEQSDVDVYLFSRGALPGARRRELVEETLGPASEAVSWGADEPFVQGGTDFVHRGVRVECWLRSAAAVEGTLAACVEGRIRREPAVWTVMGFFDYVALADVRSMRVVEDPHGMLARWKDAVAAYPEPLRRAVLGRFMAEAAFWPENFHYRSAVERADVIYTSGIVQQTLHSLIQVAFALNREYFPGEKKLAVALAKLPALPEAFAPRVQALLCPGRDPGVAELREQRRELAALMAELRGMVEAEGREADAACAPGAEA
ncbi:MAG TPA: DUF4037 domain-containing protein [Longimicrobiaceae bacterium]